MSENFAYKIEFFISGVE